MNNASIDQKISLREISRRLTELCKKEKFDYVVIKKIAGDFVPGECGPCDIYENKFMASIHKTSDASFCFNIIGRESIADAVDVRSEILDLLNKG